MAEILDRFDVNKTLIDIIKDAESEIILISPYIKLNPILKQALEQHKSKNDFKLILVYGKNEEDNKSSLSDSDFDFFKTFKNVEIRYHKRLHAKVYANDFDTLITSMNLHTYSMNENIEIGILLKMNLLRDIGSAFSSFIGNSLEDQARGFCDYVITKSELQFHKEAQKNESFFGFVKTYEASEILIDKRKSGYCIRTGKAIAFNVNRPMCDEAYRSWERYKDENYREKFCHFSGEPSNGETSFSKPILRKNWSKAKSLFSF